MGSGVQEKLWSLPVPARVSSLICGNPKYKIIKTFQVEYFMYFFTSYLHILGYFINSVLANSYLLSSFISSF